MVIRKNAEITEPKQSTLGAAALGIKPYTPGAKE